MKRKYKRKISKRLGILAAINVAAITIIGPKLYTFIKPLITVYIKKVYPLCSDAIITLIALLILLLIVIILIFIISKGVLVFFKPNKKYFAVIDFERPTNEILTKAIEGILNSEKAQPFFVHVAPINNEIDQFYQALDTRGFVWVNGKPGDGKTMLAYNALYRYRKRIGINFWFIHYIFLRLKYKSYLLDINKISDEKEIDQVLDELDYLKGRKRKIVLVDDAHKISFEGKLRHEFEEEAKEQINGKFVWVNTNYLEINRLRSSDSINIEFESFYPNLLKGLYQSSDPILNDIIKKNSHGIEEAIKQKNKCRIKDPWHFNFVASNGERRIIQLLEKLSGKKEEQDILLLTIFLFSVRNVITGEKEINQTGLVNLLENIEIPYFKKILVTYKPNDIISDLASQDKGRFLIIQNKTNLDRGFLQAPHFRLSVAIIKAITTQFTDEKFIKQIIDSSTVLLTSDFRDSKYFGIYFNSLGKYQEYFLNINKDWVVSFCTKLILDQLHVYPSFLSILKKNHYSFYIELLTDEYFIHTSLILSSVNPNRFAALSVFIRLLGTDKGRLLGKFKDSDWKTLASNASKAEVVQLSQVADFIYALGNDSAKLLNNFKDIDWETLAHISNRAEVAQFSQVADLINALGTDKVKLLGKFKDSDWEKLANKANEAEVDQIKQVADFIYALGNDRAKLLVNFKDSDWETLAQKVKDAKVAQFKQVADFIYALGTYRKKLLGKFKDPDWETLAQKAKKADVVQFAQLEAIANALGTDKVNLLGKFKDSDWETLASNASKAEVAQLSQVADFIHVLGTDKMKLLGRFNDSDWETIAQKINKAAVAQIRQVAEFLNASGDYRLKLAEYFNTDSIISYSLSLDRNNIPPFCLIIASLEEKKQNQVIQNIDWNALLRLIVINHKVTLSIISYILNYNTKKCNLLNKNENHATIKEYLNINRNKIIYYSINQYTAPDDYKTCAFILNALIPYSFEMNNDIVEKLKYKIICDFNISPTYYKSFSNLLNAIHIINPSIGIFILENNLVWQKLFSSFQNDNFNDQILGLKNLLMTIKNINPDKYKEIIELKSIKKLDFIDVVEDENTK